MSNQPARVFLSFLDKSMKNGNIAVINCKMFLQFFFPSYISLFKVHLLYQELNGYMCQLQIGFYY